MRKEQKCIDNISPHMNHRPYFTMDVSASAGLLETTSTSQKVQLL
jgi:hypothetical protein